MELLERRVDEQNLERNQHMILIIGGTGKVGRRVVEQLAARKVPTRIFVRTAHPELAELGVETAIGDLGSISSVEAALRGVDRVFLLTPPMQDEAAVKGAIVDAARNAGVKHIVLQSGAGAVHGSPISQARQHAAADDYLKGSGVAFTILQPYFFMQNLLAQAAAINSQGAMYGNVGSGKLAMVDAGDIAAVAVECLTEDGQHDGRTYVITGPEAITHAEAAQTIASLLGRPVRYVNVLSQQLVSTIVAAGTPEWLAHDLAMLGEDIAAGQFAQTTDVVERVAKKRPVTFEQFVKDNVAGFSENADPPARLERK